MDQVNKNVTFRFVKSSIIKRFWAFFLDLCLGALIESILFVVAYSTSTNLNIYKENYEVRYYYLDQSKLFYYDEEGNYLEIDSYLEQNNELSIEEKVYFIKENLEYFYKNELFFKNNDGVEILNSLYKDAYISNEKMFDENWNILLTNQDYLDDYFNFYKSLISDSVSYLYLNSEFNKANLNIFLICSIPIVVSFLITVTLIFFVIPLFLKRGRRTIGMCACKTFVVNSEGLNPTTKQHIIRYLFFLAFEVIGGILSLGITWLISVGMMFLRNDSQTIHDYFSKCYMVEGDYRKLYLDSSEYKGDIL